MSIEQVVRVLIGLILDLIPHQEAKIYLDDEARKRAELAADIAEAAKFSGGE